MDPGVDRGYERVGQVHPLATHCTPLDLPYHTLDALHFIGDNWQRVGRDEFCEEVRKIIARDQWIIDGNYGAVREDIWSRATDVVWLDLPFPVVFWQALSRTARRIRDHEPLYAGSRESFRHAFLSLDGIPWWVVRTYRRRRREFGRRLPAITGIRLHHLRSRRDIEALVARIGRERGAADGPVQEKRGNQTRSDRS